VHGGRGEMAGLLDELEEKFGTETANLEAIRRNYDVVVIGGGPAGSAAAIYSARKGLNVAIVAERIGGQVKDTVGIENLISVPQTTGAELASNLGKHIGAYPIDVFENRKIESAALHGCPKEISVKGGETFVAGAVIIATGASWRKLGVEGEADYLGRGVHFCPHCDGPFYKGKRVAVIGGGNSGIEAALDLAGICSHVTVLEFADKLLADNVLQEKARATENIEIFTMSQTTAVLGDGQKVTGLRVKDRNTEQEREISLDGIFVQIGLAPNTQAFAEQLELSPRREIQVDRTCRTSVSGVYAAGDCTDVPYKQIVVAIGEGAKASLSAFDDRVRGVIG
jgi:alkyl hydroperoxide reductase, F subunit